MQSRRANVPRHAPAAMMLLERASARHKGRRSTGPSGARPRSCENRCTLGVHPPDIGKQVAGDPAAPPAAVSWRHFDGADPSAADHAGAPSADVSDADASRGFPASNAWGRPGVDHAATRAPAVRKFERSRVRASSLFVKTTACPATGHAEAPEVVCAPRTRPLRRADRCPRKSAAVRCLRPRAPPGARADLPKTASRTGLPGLTDLDARRRSCDRRRRTPWRAAAACTSRHPFEARPGRAAPSDRRGIPSISARRRPAARHAEEPWPRPPESRGARHGRRPAPPRARPGRRRTTSTSRRRAACRS